MARAEHAAGVLRLQAAPAGAGFTPRLTLQKGRAAPNRRLGCKAAMRAAAGCLGPLEHAHKTGSSRVANGSIEIEAGLPLGERVVRRMSLMQSCSGVAAMHELWWGGEVWGGLHAAA